MLASAFLLAAAVLAATYHHYQRSGRDALGFMLVLVVASGTLFALLAGLT